MARAPTDVRSGSRGPDGRNRPRSAASGPAKARGAVSPLKNPVYLGGAGILLALLAVFIFLLGSESPPPPEPQALAVEPAAPTQADVLFVVRTITAGRRPVEQDFMWVARDLDRVGPLDIVRGRNPNAIAELRGQYAVTKVEGDAPARRSQFESVSGGILASLLHPGERAYTLSVDNRTSHAGFLVPGDRVDVVLTVALDDEVTSEPIIQNVRVLAVDQRYSGLEKVEPPAGEADRFGARDGLGDEAYALLVTLATTFEQSVKLAAGAQTRDAVLSFPLRNPFDDKIIPKKKPEPVKPDTRKHVWLLRGIGTVYRECDPYCDKVLETQSVVLNRNAAEKPREDPYSNASRAITNSFRGAIRR